MPAIIHTVSSLERYRDSWVDQCSRPEFWGEIRQDLLNPENIRSCFSDLLASSLGSYAGSRVETRILKNFGLCGLQRMNLGQMMRMRLPELLLRTFAHEVFLGVTVGLIEFVKHPGDFRGWGESLFHFNSYHSLNWAVHPLFSSPSGIRNPLLGYIMRRIVGAALMTATSGQAFSLKTCLENFFMDAGFHFGSHAIGISAKKIARHTLWASAGLFIGTGLGRLKPTPEIAVRIIERSAGEHPYSLFIHSFEIFKSLETQVFAEREGRILEFKVESIVPNADGLKMEVKLLEQGREQGVSTICLHADRISLFHVNTLSARVRGLASIWIDYLATTAARESKLFEVQMIINQRIFEILHLKRIFNRVFLECRNKFGVVSWRETSIKELLYGPPESGETVRGEPNPNLLGEE